MSWVACIQDGATVPDEELLEEIAVRPLSDWGNTNG